MISSNHLQESLIWLCMYLLKNRTRTIREAWFGWVCTYKETPLDWVQSSLGRLIWLSLGLQGSFIWLSTYLLGILNWLSLDLQTSLILINLDQQHALLIVLLKGRQSLQAAAIMKWDSPSSTYSGSRIQARTAPSTNSIAPSYSRSCWAA